MKKNVKFLLPMLAVMLLLGLSSVSCASNVKGKKFKCEGADMTIEFTTKSDCTYVVAGDEMKGTHKVEKKKITCKVKKEAAGVLTENDLKFDIINAKTLKDQLGLTWKKV